MDKCVAKRIEALRVRTAFFWLRRMQTFNNGLGVLCGETLLAHYTGVEP